MSTGCTEKKKRDEELVRIVPTERQARYQALEFYAFVHFTVNTFTDREWGDGTESESVFAPRHLDAMQWASAVKSAGMKGLILTCKHHDGFCLWPSAYTEHSVKNSPYKNGLGDVVRETAEACRAYGLKFGVYLSPWDRNSALYGQGKAYDNYFVAQLTELLTNYGEIFTVWLDGACGEGPNGKKQYYDFPRYYETVRRLQPNACINVCGPDIRWCGNEAGHTRASEWSVVPLRMRDTEIVKEKSQQEDSSAFRERKLSAMDEDLGSRAALADEKDLIWYPAEVNTSIRPGWFYHASEDDKVRSAGELVDIYCQSAGGNAMFLLNIPPTPEGLFHENDVACLREIGEILRAMFTENKAERAVITASSEAEGFEAENLRCEEKSEEVISQSSTEQEYGVEVCSDSGAEAGGDAAGHRCWIPADTEGPWEITIRFERPETIRTVVLKENIRMSQRVEAFTVEAVGTDGKSTVDTDESGREGTIVLGEGTIIGYKKILRFEPVTTSEVRIRITDARTVPTLEFVGVY